MALLDTTVYVDLRGRGGARRKAEAEEIMRRLLQDGETLVTSRINVAEIYCGVELGNDPQTELMALDDFLAWIGVLELDDRAARHFAIIRAELQKRGNLAGDMDTLIGGIALANGHSVVTRNQAHFINMPGLTVIRYGT
jgi:tRNA(fMet)-specific endonuclease VapC